MKTVSKITMAKAAYRVVHALRTAAGRSDVSVCRRGGSRFELDLAQAIDLSIFLLGGFEIGTRNALRRLIRPGFVAVDIGANIGAHTLNMARLVGPKGRVLACEPTHFAFAKLCRNIGLNPDVAARVIPIQCFLGPPDLREIPGVVYSGWPLKGGLDLHPKHLGSVEATDGSTCRSLDEIVETRALPRVDLIKMDVDGFECEVLSGAGTVMRRDRPIFVMEVSPYVLEERGGSLSRFLSYFQALDYEFLDEKMFDRIPMEEGKLRAMIGDGASRNVVAKARSMDAGHVGGPR